MVRVFVSYAREDKPRVAMLVQRLREYGLSVGWDDDFELGEEFRKLINAGITAASHLIVVWSEASIDSIYVQGEVELASKKKKKLLSLRFQDVDPPLPWNAVQFTDLFDWDGDAADENFCKIVQALGRPLLDKRKRPWLHRRLMAAVGLFIALTAGSAAAYWIAHTDPKPKIDDLVLPSAGAPGHPGRPDPSAQPAAGGTGSTLGGSAGSNGAKPSSGGSVGSAGARSYGPRKCCHSTGSEERCAKLRCADCGLKDCP